MRIEKGKIELGDDVYATLTVAGETVVELKDAEATGVDDVMRKLRRLARHCSGVAKVYIRNRTRGWAMQIPMLICKSLLSVCSREELVADGYCESNGQLIIRF